MGVLHGGVCLTHTRAHLICMCSHVQNIHNNAGGEVSVLHSRGGECTDIPVCPAECVCVLAAGRDFGPVQLSHKSNWSAVGCYSSKGPLPSP